MYSADTRPRIKYALPDGRVLLVVQPRNSEPLPMVPFDVAPGDELWPIAQRRAGSAQRFVLARLAVGL